MVAESPSILTARALEARILFDAAAVATVAEAAPAADAGSAAPAPAASSPQQQAAELVAAVAAAPSADSAAGPHDAAATSPAATPAPTAAPTLDAAAHTDAPAATTTSASATTTAADTHAAATTTTSATATTTAADSHTAATTTTSATSADSHAATASTNGATTETTATTSSTSTAPAADAHAGASATTTTTTTSADAHPAATTSTSTTTEAATTAAASTTASADSHAAEAAAPAPLAPVLAASATASPTDSASSAGSAATPLAAAPLDASLSAVTTPTASPLDPAAATSKIAAASATDALALKTTTTAAPLPAVTATPTEVVFIDSRVIDGGAAPTNFAAGASVTVLSADRDGVTQIAEVLAGLQGVETVHIVAHGGEGALALGSTSVTLNSLSGEQGAALAAWGSSLSAGADIMIWGCDVGAGTQGDAFVQQIAKLTGADVAASDDATGEGGDWTLEVVKGTLNGDGADVAAALAGAHVTLAAPTVTIAPASLPRQVQEDSSATTLINANGTTSANASGNKIFDSAQTTIKGGDVTITGPANVAVQLTATKGTLVVNTTTGTNNTGFDLDGTDGTIKLVGSLADVNAAIKSISYIPTAGANSTDNSTLATTADDNVNGTVAIRAWEITDTATWATGLDSGTQTVQVEIAPINDAPTLKTEGDPGYARATVQEDSATPVTLGDANFKVLDVDTQAVQVVYTVTAAPSQGTLWFTTAAGAKIAQLDVDSTFTQADLSAGKVRYYVGGAEVATTSTDFFRVTIEDGASGKIGNTAGDAMTNVAPNVAQGTKIYIDITPKNDAPTLTLTQGPVFENYTNGAGQAGTVFSLAVGDVDDAGAGDHVIKFTALPTASIDPDGSGAAAASTVSAGQLLIDQGNNGTWEAVTVGTGYSKAELATLRYVAPDAEVGTSYDGAAQLKSDPTFSVQVTDNGGGAGAGAKLTTTQTFAIKVAAVNDDPVFTTDANNDGVVDTVVAIDHNVTNVKTFSTAQFNTTDADSANLNRYFELTQLPTSGVITLNLGGTEYALRVGDSFTQQDVIDGKVKFYDLGAEGTEQIKFKVSDGGFNALPGANGRESGDPVDPATAGATASWRGEHTLNFTIANGATPPTTGYTGPGNISQANMIPMAIGAPSLKLTGVDESGATLTTATLGNSTLNYGIQTGAGPTYLDANKIIYTVTSLPADGTLVVNGTTLGAYGTFTQADVDAGTVKYVHGGGEGFLDNFKFRVSAGAAPTAEQTFSIFNNPVNDAPVAGQSSLLTVKEGGTVAIGTAHMSVTDVDGVGDDFPQTTGTGHDTTTPANSGLTPDTLTFQFTTLPTHGTVQWFDGAAWQNVTASTTWGTTYAVTDIAAGKFRYVHDGSENYNDSYVIQGKDDGGKYPYGGAKVSTPLTSNLQTINIGVSPVNDTPVVNSATFQFLGEGQTVTITGLGAASVATPAGATAYAGDADIDAAVLAGTYNPNLRYDDPDNPTVNTNNPSPGTTVQVQYLVTDTVSHGQIMLNGKVIGVGSTFTQEDINNGKLSYRHDGSQSYTDQFKFTVRDGNKTTVEDTYKFFIDTALRTNDAPEITAAPTGPIKVTDNSAITFSGANKITLADKDLDSPQGTSFDAVRVSVSANLVTGGTGQGQFILGTTTGLTIIDGVGGGAATTGSDGKASTLMVEGSLANVQTWLNQLQYQADAGASAATDLDGKIKIEVKLTDRALGTSVDWSNATAASSALAFTNFTQANQNLDASNNGGKDPITDAGYTADYNIVSKNFEIWASAQNDAPTLSLTATNQTAAEDSWTTVSGFSFTDAEGFMGATSYVATVTLSQDGQIKFTPSGAATVAGDTTGSTATTAITSGTKVVTISGSAADVQATLASMQFRSSANQHTNNATISVQVSDGGGSGQGGVQTSTAQMVTIDITPVNDPVAFTLQSTAIQKIDATTQNNGVATAVFDSSNPLVFSTANGNRISFDDAADRGQTPYNDTYTVTITSKDASNNANFGTLTAGSVAGLDVASDTNGADGTLTLIGTKAQVQAALDGLKFEPPAYNADKQVNISFTVNDMANGGTAVALGAGAATTDTKTVVVQISGSNDAPVLNTAATITATEDQTLNLPTNSLSFDDPDDFGGEIWATVAVTKGGLSFNGATAGVNGAGSDLDGSDGTIKLVGTEAAILAALNQLQFNPTTNGGGADQNATNFATLTLTVNDQGNMGVGGAKQATSNVTIKVNPVNDAPTRLAPSVALAHTNEDAASPGRTVTSLFNAGVFSDAADNQTALTGGSSANSIAGVAVVGNAATATQGQWQYSTDGTTWVALPTGSYLNNAVILKNTDQIRFNPTADWNGTPGDLSVRLIDSSSGGVTTTTGVDLSAGGATGGTTQYANLANQVALGIVVDPVNDAPTRTAATATLAAIDEDDAAPVGDTIANLVSGKFNDAVDTVAGGSTANAFAGVAITANTANAATEGVWQYQLGGAGAWVNLPAVSTTGALVLAPTDKIRFLPVANYNGTPGGLDVRLIDDSSPAPASTSVRDMSGGGSGGITPYANAANAIAINTTVNPVNDAPLLNAGAHPEVQSPLGGGVPTGAVGMSITSLIANQSDIDAGAVKGLALTSTSGAGTWYYSTNNGTTWSLVGAVGNNNALLLAADPNTRIYYQGGAAEIGAIPNAAVYRAWDQTSGTNGGRGDATTHGGISAYSTAAGALDLNIVNYAPTLTAGANQVIAQVEDAAAPTGAVGTLVSGLLGVQSDQNSGALKGLAITGVSGPGTWWWSIDDGGTWTQLNAASDAQALLLTADAGVRLYVQANADVNGTLTNALTFRAWDQTDGSANGDVVAIAAAGGTTAFSTTTAKLNVAVTAVNDAPTRSAPIVTLPTIMAGAPSAPQTTAALFSSGIYLDVADDQPATAGSAANAYAGVAVVGSAASIEQGVWQYSTNNGTSWVDVPAGGQLNAATLLSPTDLVRFKPADGFAGQPGALQVRMIDASGGAVATTPGVNLSAGGATGGVTRYANLANQVDVNITVLAIGGGGGGAPRPVVVEPPPEPPALVPPVVVPPTVAPPVVEKAAEPTATPNAPSANFIAPTPAPTANDPANPVNLFAPKGGKIFSDLSNPFEGFGQREETQRNNIPYIAIDPVRLNVVLQDRIMDGDGVQTFGVPGNAFQHTNPMVEIAVDATRPDGSPLPGWVRFDQKNMRFFVDMAMVRFLGVESVDIRLTGKDPAGNEAASAFQVKFLDVDESENSQPTAPAKPAPAPAAKTEAPAATQPPADAPTPEKPPQAPAKQDAALRMEGARAPALAALFGADWAQDWSQTPSLDAPAGDALALAPPPGGLTAEVDQLLAALDALAA